MTALLSGWGRTASTRAEVVRPDTTDRLAACINEPSPRGLIARGLGRSYGDAAQNAGGTVVVTTAVDGILDFDIDRGVVTAEAGVSLDALMRRVVPHGWFVPVSPGTRFVTVGGAVAADIHGKNHHADGTWCQHVASMRLQAPTGDTVTASPSTNAEIFWATAGGMGLTGLVLDATIQLRPIETSRLVVDTERAPDLDRTLAALREADRHHRYTVAWIDLMAQRASLGRSVLTSGDFAPAAALGDHTDPLAFDPRTVIGAPAFVPSVLLNRASVRAFNEGWFRKAPRRRQGELQTISAFFHPLDAVAGWNRVYGRGGLLQWQIVLPDGAEPILDQVVETLSDARAPSFLAVLKRFGPANPGPLSFPSGGWTLALDLAAADADLGALLAGLDERVADAGGRVYLAKDSRLDPALLPVMYPRLDEWRDVRARLDPDRVLTSDLARRLGL